MNPDTVTLTVTLPLNLAQALLAQMAEGNVDATPADDTPAAPAKRGRGRPPKAAAEKAPKPKTSRDELLTLVQQVMNDQGRDVAKETIAAFGASKLSEVKPEDYDALADRLRACGDASDDDDDLSN